MATFTSAFLESLSDFADARVVTSSGIATVTLSLSGPEARSKDLDLGTWTVVRSSTGGVLVTIGSVEFAAAKLLDVVQNFCPYDCDWVKAQVTLSCGQNRVALLNPVEDEKDNHMMSMTEFFDRICETVDYSFARADLLKPVPMSPRALLEQVTEDADDFEI